MLYTTHVSLIADIIQIGQERTSGDFHHAGHDQDVLIGHAVDPCDISQIEASFASG